MKYIEIVGRHLLKAFDEDKELILVSQGLRNKYAYGGAFRELWKRYPDRAYDYPLSEASIPDFCLGLALGQMKPIMHFGRSDFMLYASAGIQNTNMWRYIFGLDKSITLWVAVKRGREREGALHTNVHLSMLENLCGVNVFTPFNASAMLGALEASRLGGVFNILYENSDLYGVEEKDDCSPLSVYDMMEPKVLKDGKSGTIIAYSSSVHDVLNTIGHKDYKVIGMHMLKPFDYNSLKNEIVGDVVVVEQGYGWCSPASEIARRLSDVKVHSCPEYPCQSFNEREYMEYIKNIWRCL